MRTVVTRAGARLPVLGQGTWLLGEDRRRRATEADSLRLGLDLGLTLIDTAEMYANGGAEEVVGEAIRGRRDGVFLVSKVLPQNASRRGTIEAAERSLRRLGTDRIDLYLLHWPSYHPLEETLQGFAGLQRDGKILHYGVSNFDAGAVARAQALPGGAGIAVNQVAYNLERRGIERRLIPECVARGVPVMAYSPLEQGGLQSREALARVAARHRAAPAQIALAWTVRLPGVAAVVKAADPEHVRANARAAEIALEPRDLEELDAAFPAPSEDVPLDLL